MPRCGEQARHTRGARHVPPLAAYVRFQQAEGKLPDRRNDATLCSPERDPRACTGPGGLPAPHLTRRGPDAGDVRPSKKESS